MVEDAMNVEALRSSRIDEVKPFHRLSTSPEWMVVEVKVQKLRAERPRSTGLVWKSNTPD